MDETPFLPYNWNPSKYDHNSTTGLPRMIIPDPGTNIKRFVTVCINELPANIPRLLQSNFLLHVQ